MRPDCAIKGEIVVNSAPTKIARRLRGAGSDSPVIRPQTRAEVLLRSSISGPEYSSMACTNVWHSSQNRFRPSPLKFVQRFAQGFNMANGPLTPVIIRKMTNVDQYAHSCPRRRGANWLVPKR